MEQQPALSISTVRKSVIFCAVIIVLIGFFISGYYTFRKKAVSKSRLMMSYSVPHDSVKKIVLSNGMNVLMFVNKSMPKVLMQVAYEVGSNVEQEGERGLAHLLEHMIFKGTNKLKEGDIDTIARKFGASFNAFTTKEVTSYYFETNSANWKPFIEILADCMQNVRFDEQHLASEMRAVVQELRMRRDNHLVAMYEKMAPILYPANNPYHYPIIGFKEDLSTISALKLKNFYLKYYHPAKATLFVVGDINPEHIIEEVQKHFGKIPGRVHAEPERSYKAHTDITNATINMFHDVQREQLGFFWSIPGKKQISDVLAKAAAHILAGGDGSRLHKKMVDEHKVASSVDVVVDQYNFGGQILLVVHPQQGKSEECRKILEQELLQIAQQGVSEHELEKMVIQKQREFFDTLEQSSSLAFAWISSYFSTRDEFDIFNKPQKFSKISQAEIKEFFASYLDPFCMHKVSVLPLPESKRVLWQKAQHQEEEFERSLLAKNKRTAPVEKPEYVHKLARPHYLNFSFPKPDRVVTLENGLKVILKKRETWPTISVAAYMRDAEYYVNAKEGSAVALMMDMLMEGTIGATKEENVSFFESHGVSYKFKQNGAFLHFLNVGYKDVLKQFFNVLTNPVFPTEHLEKLKNIYIEGCIHGKDSPQDMAIRTLKNKVYHNHPYQWTFDEAIEQIKKLKQADIIRMHHQIVGPEHMVLSIVGNFDLDEMHHTVKEIFGRWHGAPYHVRQQSKSFYTPSRENVLMLRDQVALLLGRPSPLSMHDDDFVIACLANIILFNSLGSRLFHLREQSGLFYTSSGGWALNVSREHGFDMVYAIVNPDNADYAEKAIKELLTKSALEGLTNDELEAARQIYVKMLLDLVTSSRMTAALFARLEALGLGFDYYDKVLARVQTLPLKELNEWCARHLNDKDMTTIRVGRIAQ